MDSKPWVKNDLMNGVKYFMFISKKITVSDGT
jgi:hypothetical protein